MCPDVCILVCILKTESITVILISSLLFYYISRLQNKLVRYEDDFFAEICISLFFDEILKFIKFSISLKKRILCKYTLCNNILYLIIFRLYKSFIFHLSTDHYKTEDKKE